MDDAPPQAVPVVFGSAEPDRPPSADGTSLTGERVMCDDTERAGDGGVKPSGAEPVHSEVVNCGTQIFADYYPNRTYVERTVSWSPLGKVLPAPGPVAKMIAIVGGVGFGAVLGVLLRNRLGSWCEHIVAPSGAVGEEAIVIKEIIANAVGCFVMGLAVEIQPRLQPPHPTVYAGITTGFCGCLTTFSTFHTKVCEIAYRSGSAELGIACALVALALGASTAWTGLQFGRFLAQPREKHLASMRQAHQDLVRRFEEKQATSGGQEEHGKALAAIEQSIQELEQAAPEMVMQLKERPPKLIREKVVFYWSCLTLALITAVVFVAVDQDNLQDWVVAACCAPLGAWLRYGLGFRNKYHSFPLYTMLCNVGAAAGSALLAVLLDKACGFRPEESQDVALLGGVSAGFFGSLSTVSTFVDELRRLGAKRRSLAVGYALATLIAAQLVAALVLIPSYAAGDCF